MKAHLMKTLKTVYAAAAFALAAFAPAASRAAAVEVLNEGFSYNVAALPGWVHVNNSVSPGSGWFRGNPEVFGAQAGPANSYAAANYLSAAYGSGSVDNWLITPTLTLSGTTLLSFFTRAAGDPGFADKLEVRFSSGSGSGTAGFTTLLGTIGPNGYPSDWQQFSSSLDFDGTGRFAFRYLGDAMALNYIGIDSVTVMTAVPEPSLYMMLGLGLGLLALLRRKLGK
jgi:hypothetical protein